MPPCTPHRVHGCLQQPDILNFLSLNKSTENTLHAPPLQLADAHNDYVIVVGTQAQHVENESSQLSCVSTQGTQVVVDLQSVNGSKQDDVDDGEHSY
eukprot:3446513-Rhodomonas_salina.6